MSRSRPLRPWPDQDQPVSNNTENYRRTVDGVGGCICGNTTCKFCQPQRHTQHGNHPIFNTQIQIVPKKECDHGSWSVSGLRPGFTCQKCGFYDANRGSLYTPHECVYEKDGTCNKCLIKIPDKNSTTKKPHKCPVCEGNGSVFKMIPAPMPLPKVEHTCNACSGSGIVWG